MKLPEIFKERLYEIYPAYLADRILKSFEYRKNTTFRINLIKAKREEVLRELKKEGFILQNVNFYPDAFILKNKSLRELAETRVYREGKIYVQNLSSMLPPLILSPQAGENILDLASAPGSKTTQLACLLENKAKIVAVEKIKPRYYKLLANLQHQGVCNTEVLLEDGIKVWRRYPEFFDKVLLDAPCSSEARFFISNPRTFMYWKIRKVKECAKKQKGLLLSGLRALKVGAILVYSTCTFSPEENEMVLNWLLKRVGDRVRIEPISLKIKNILPALRGWRGRNFPEQISNAIRIIPDENMEGFFIAKIRKIAPITENN